VPSEAESTGAGQKRSLARKYFIETFGCQMNVHDSERMSGLLERAGFEPAASDADADVVVINTCSVREHAEDKLYTRLGELRVLEEETGRRRTVAVTGCVAQQEGAALFGNANGHVIDVVVGTQRVKMLPVLVDGRVAGEAPRLEIGRMDDVSFPLGVARHFEPVKAYVTIIEGCNDHCAFCVVPHTRGHERMRPRADILAEVRAAVEAGRQEIQLLGQIVNHYQDPDDPSCDFAQLLADVNGVEGVTRIRFASPHPRHTGQRLIDAIAGLPKVCKHLHLPVQSGSTRVLRAMRRRHTREDYLSLVDRVRLAVPGISLSTDMIVGFPGETETDFEDTLSLTAAARFHGMFSFKYSPRPNTLARQRFPDDVTESEKTARIVALQALQRSIQTELHESAVGTEVEVLVDSVSRRHREELSGRSMTNTVVNFPRPTDTSDGALEAWIGRTVRVRVEAAGPHSVRGRAIQPDERVPC
jgi:tRNA-2-methylthio-N6-dimethylallyladenosine synthase